MARGALVRQRRMISLLLAGYVVLAVAGDLFAPNREIFPVFSWSLFTHAHDRSTLLELEVLEIDGERLPGPLAYPEVRERLGATGPAGSSLTKLLRNTVRARMLGETPDALLSRLERHYLGGGTQRVRWQISALVFDPIERYRSGAILERRVLFSGTTGAGVR